MLEVEWDDNINCFWYGANGCEYIAWKGSHHVFVFPTWEYPKPPSEIIQHNTRIETVEEFEKALEMGERMKVTYERMNSSIESTESA